MRINCKILFYFGGINIYIASSPNSHIIFDSFYGMQVNYIILFNEIMKYNVKLNKTYKYNVVTAGIFL